MRGVSIIILFFIALLDALAVPAYPYPVEVTQPDGSRLLLFVRGDESLRFRTTIMGDMVKKGKDGFYHPTFDVPKSETKINKAEKWASEVEEIRTLVIPVEFLDVKFSIENPKEHFDNMVNLEGYSEHGATGSVKDYFEDNLQGMKNIYFKVADVVSLDKELAYYGENDEDARGTNRIYDIRLEEMFKEACLLSDKSVDFSDFDYVYLYYAGYSEAEGGDVNTIWPVSIDMSHNPVRLDGTTITMFGCGSELRGASSSIPSGIGAFCHEFGHLLGLPDLYDVDHELGGQSKGMWGSLSLMDYGCYNNRGRTPPYFNAIERELLGKKPARLTMNAELRLEPIHKTGFFFRVDTSNDGEYYLLEARDGVGWDSHIGGEGMLVYHIDKSQNIAGQIQASVRWDINKVNSYSLHECADLVEALPNAVNVKQVFFPGVGKVDKFATLTDPHFVDWEMRGVGVKFDDIKIEPSSGGVTFRVESDKDEILLKPLDVLVKCDQREAVLTWESEIDMVAKWGIEWRVAGEEFDRNNTKLIDSKSCVLDNLKGGTDYECLIYHNGYRSNGDTVAVKFKTVSITSQYPYIQGVEPVYSVGDSTSLKIYNMSEMVRSVKWFYDGVEIKNGKLSFQEEGIHEVVARIKYEYDGSEEVIKKVVEVKNENVN